MKVRRYEIRVCEAVGTWDGRRAVHAASDAVEILGGELRTLAVEQFWVLLLDGKHRLLKTARVSEGTLTTSLVHPREVFRMAVAEGAAAVIVTHNHPSGDPEPSAEDAAVTKRLTEAGRLLGIPVLDHIIIGGDGHVSLCERGAL